MNNAGQITEIMNFLGGKNMDAESMVRMICKKRNIDVDQFMKNLQV